MRNHKNNVNAKILELQATVANVQSDFEKMQIELQQRQVIAAEKANSEAAIANAQLKENASKEKEERKAAAVAKATAKENPINEDMDDLRDKINSVAEWSEESDVNVRKGMRDMANWKEELSRITMAVRELKEIVSEFDISPLLVNLYALETRNSDLATELKRICNAIEREDKDRALYSLDNSKFDLVKLPTFSGQESEDFVKFKDEMIRGFVQNRICKADQPAKLQECLRDHPLRLIPESTVTTVAYAWEILQTAFGNAAKVMKYKKEQLLEVGPVPRENPKTGYKPQIKWFMQLENHLRGIIDLGK